MKTNIFLLFFLLFHFFAEGQTLKIIDHTTRQTIPGVSIYSLNPKKSTTTNSKGEADLKDFKTADTIHISFIGYEKIQTNYTELQSKKFKLELKESVIKLVDVVVSASRWEEKDKEIPYRVEKISVRDVNFKNPQTTADLLESGGYAYVQKSQMAGGSPMLRGFATNRVLLVVDGVRMNTAIFRSGNVQNVISVDANSLQETEIIFGPGAVMYGSDAIGGVMDFHTLKPFVSDSSKTQFSGSAFARYSSANFEKTGHLDFNIATKKFGFTTAFTYGDYSDLMAGSNGNSYFLRPTYQTTINGVDTTLTNSNPKKQIHSGFSQTNFMQKILMKKDSVTEWEYGFYYSASSDAPRYDRLVLDNNNDGKLDNAQWYYGPQKWMMHRLSYKISRSKKAFDRFKMNAAYQNFEESRHDRKTGSTKMRNQYENVQAISINLDLDKKIKDNVSIYYGAESIVNIVGSIADKTDINTGISTNEPTRYPNGSVWKSLAAYGNLKYKINPRLILNTGLRYSFITIKTEFDTLLFPFPFVSVTNKFGSLNGAIGLVHNITWKWNWYVNLSTGFRAPNVDDIGKVFESEPGSVVVPNVNLKPENAYNAEIGSQIMVLHLLKAEASVYYVYLNQALARRDFTYNGSDSIIYDGVLSRVQAIQNISNAFVYGVQGGLEIAFGNGFGLKSVLNYQYGRELSVDSAVYYPLSHAAPLFGNTHFTYQTKNIRADFYMNYNSGMSFEELSLNDRNDDATFAKDENGKPFVPSWYTLNFKFAYFLNKNLSLNAGVENITDVLYRPFSSGISAPGRNFILTLRGNF